MFKNHKTVERVQHTANTEFHPKTLAVRAAQDAIFIAPYISNSQARDIANSLQGEHGAAMMKRIVAIASVIESIAISPEQTGLNDNTTVYLHYQLHNWHWYITERMDGGRVDQAFGYVMLATDRQRGLEFKPVSIIELLAHGCVLDLNFSPQSVHTIKQSNIVH
ncbi:hypothetical protein [Methylomonas methanica]|uniref:Uncharacterized protein n=1 Tax=Methylomonas methanica TaxID=421 RepID=A0A177MH08_METMH|nr:hypothetical protein [Methylomonas methanica]OAI04902.1 hypothetical protein A1332_13835 [Methylomonas methanica]